MAIKSRSKYTFDFGLDEIGMQNNALCANNAKELV